ncbi:bifunctional glutamate N-acetyltransferase/amino-acid acetyltransferase ArgJ [Egicoccus halophilus]|uniref:Arginine biosynthesis bifunctional protein ArgJ n=1 Tax=Egicoccus halophilus TaxID=1670830 RepID=A0A8J3A9G6_9ACTN|nr:bifunctional glutamate N-acetyltransferase/amino-acid acetyltransferase ArgJ [Egicoccus halophilus]GGI07498.1 arginine biosynthesis bifunctional protein ArgJ [Egicoccus halophilus]
MIGDWGPQDRSGLTPVPGGATAADGFRAGGVASGVKASGRPDLALVVADVPAGAAAVTTTNLVKAPACHLTDRHVANGRAQAIVINAGNANVCTPEGEAHAQRLADATAEQLGLLSQDVLVMSTGVIGVPLPVQRIEAALPALAAGLTRDGGDAAAHAMLTTDTRTKQVAYRVSDEQGSCVVGGMAKGVGMIEPAMATLLVVVTTDAPLSGPVGRQLLRAAVSRTFNRISVDGDGSTSDTVALLASGAAARPPGLDTLARGVAAVCADLAHAVVSDGEGATRVAAVTVRQAATEADAETLARAVATSLLVRAALHGADPNWGRILMAMGNARVDFDPRRVSVRCGGITVCRFGVAATFDRGQAAVAMQQPEVSIEVDLGSGDAAATVLTCDLTPEYVRFNAEYTT